MSSTHVTISRIPTRLRARAAALLISEPFGRGDEAAGRQMLEAAVRHGIDLSNLWGSVDPGANAVREACLLVPGAGRTLVVFASSPSERDADRIAELAGAINAALANAPATAGLAQAIIGLDEAGARQALLASSFISAGTLQYLRRPPRPIESPPSPDSGWPAGVSVERVNPIDDADLIVALERSYEKTLDCPELCGLRRTRDVIASHRATGVWDPELWWLLRDQGEPMGAALFNPCPAQRHSELVYLGIAPPVRGRGVASRLLDLALHHTLRKHPDPVTCAVDERNIPAQRLYERAGFACFERRAAYVRPIA
ncbi:MAG: GNAT family N-acetyltransferase [Phycisphaeraceae bacterium]|nr:GNAT family N-acetyltransferase [Phycisphaeraceae bacterium]